MPITTYMTDIAWVFVTGGEKEVYLAGNETLWNVAVIIALIILILIPFRNIALIIYGYKQESNDYAKAIKQGFGFAIGGIIVSAGILYLAARVDLHPALLLTIMLLLGLISGYMVWSVLTTCNEVDLEMEAKEPDELIDRIPIQFDYNEHQMYKAGQYCALANRFKKKATKGKWVMICFGLLFFISGMIGIGWFYIEKGGIPWTLGFFIIIGPAMIALAVQLNKQYYESAKLLLKMDEQFK